MNLVLLKYITGLPLFAIKFVNIGEVWGIKLYGQALPKRQLYR